MISMSAPKEVRLINHTTVKAQQCPYCENSNLVHKVPCSKPSIHYGELICSHCNRHIQWISDPAINAKYAERKEAIDLALSSGRVVGWEAYFLRSVRERRHLSPKQQSKFDQILGNQKPLTGKVGV